METHSRRIFVGLVLAVMMAGPVSWHLAAAETKADARSATENKQAFSYEDYAAALKAYVDDNGMVNYNGLKADRERLEAFVSAIASVSPKAYGSWSDEEKIAFWVNAYNGLTLKAIIDNYPIKSSFGASLRYPKNSIRQISGVWDKLKFTVMGREMTLDDIEHRTLRVDFNEPRIHLALVCASMSCAVLLGEPYTGERLSAQLDQQTRRFLAKPKNFRVDREKRRVYISSLFKWYGEDFVKTYGTNARFAGQKQVVRAVLNFLSNYVDEKDRLYLLGEKYGIKYLDYDWSLNEQKGS